MKSEKISKKALARHLNLSMAKRICDDYERCSEQGGGFHLLAMPKGALATLPQKTTFFTLFPKKKPLLREAEKGLETVF